MRVKFFFSLVMCVFLCVSLGCGRDEPKPNSKLMPLAYYSKQSESFSDFEICAAAISRVMHRPVNTMYAKQESFSYHGKPVYYIKYRRDDGQWWDYVCSISGENIVWGTPEGRWRDSFDDSKLHYDVERKGLLVVFEDWLDGSQSKKAFVKGSF